VHFSESAPQITPGTGLKTKATRKFLLLLPCVNKCHGETFRIFICGLARKAVNISSQSASDGRIYLSEKLERQIL
jgi:hypothetical protein